MHRQPGRKRDVARERETQTVARSVADPALAQEAISPVEQLGRAEAGPLSPILALIGALAFGRTRFRRNDPISDLATPSEFAADLTRRLRSGAPILPLDPLEHRLKGGGVIRTAVSG